MIRSFVILQNSIYLLINATLLVTIMGKNLNLLHLLFCIDCFDNAYECITHAGTCKEIYVVNLFATAIIIIEKLILCCLSEKVHTTL